MNDQIKKASDIISLLFSELNQEQLKQANEITFHWKDCVGEKLSSHSKIIDVVNKTLIVEVDHPGWGQQLLFRKKEILRNFCSKVKEIEIHNIAVRVKSEISLPEREPERVVFQDTGIEKNEPVSAAEQPMHGDLARELEKLKNSIKKGKPK